MLLFIFALVVLLLGILAVFSAKNVPFLPLTFIGGIMIIASLLILLFSVALTIPAGHRGVVYDPLGSGVQHDPLSEGFHIVMPWKSVSIYSIRTQTFNMQPGGEELPVSVLTGEGLEVAVDMSIIYHLQTDEVATLHQMVGEDYNEVLIKPVSRATTRDVISTYRSEDLYTTDKRIDLQRILTEKIKEKLEPRGIVIESVLIRDIQLPAQVKNSIEMKITAEQDTKRMEFVLQKESKEAERKIIEAQGVAQSQKIISQSLDQRFLTWFWINSLEKQRSVIYVPTGSNGLPIFKDVDNVDTTLPPISNSSSISSGTR
ncbi:prohibitin family protein [Candidatus Micrarchaeota archaeon]|nr:prohibitin family protein [Candidatus Micrarchaeota archaeon]